MNCLQAEEHFSAHYEDALDYRTYARDFETHLAACEACQQEYARFQESVKVVQQLPQIEPSPDFMPTLLQRLAEQRARESAAVKGNRRQQVGNNCRMIFLPPEYGRSVVLVALILIAVTGAYHLSRRLPYSIGTPDQLWSKPRHLNGLKTWGANCCDLPGRCDAACPGETCRLSVSAKRWYNLNAGTTHAAALRLKTGELCQRLHTGWALVGSGSWQPGVRCANQNQNQNQNQRYECRMAFPGYECRMAFPDSQLSVKRF